ncbi:hypothetical protein EAE89_00610 [Photorhabdus heterorhabditis]|nr:hypothetical protein [Photorhabdus heterorhabditis]
MWFIKISYFKAFNIYFPNCLVELLSFHLYLDGYFSNNSGKGSRYFKWNKRQAEPRYMAQPWF